MPRLQPKTRIALKEWDAVCTALADGVQILLVRKGGEPFVPQDPTSFSVRSVSTILDRKVSYDEGRRYVEIRK